MTDKIQKESRILDLVETHPQVEEVFRSYEQSHGVCVLCQYLFDDVNTVAHQLDMAPKSLISELERAIKNKEIV